MIIRPTIRRLVLLAALLFAAVPALADDEEERWAIHGQSTLVWQYHPGFRSSGIRGPQSMDPRPRGAESFDATVYLGVRLWKGAEFWIDPEVDQGFGLSDTLGVAGYPNGEAYKVGQRDPYYKMPRGFLRQTFDLGGETEKVEADLLQLAGTRTANRIVVTIGKYSVVDIFDTNKYAHDPRADFLNWSLIDLASFDYAADAWGFTYGATVEWYQDWWTLRTGVFDGSLTPNNAKLDTRFVSQFQWVTEFEERHTIGEQPGKLKFLVYLTRARLGKYAQATAAALSGNTPADIEPTRDYRSKWGVGLNLEQALTDDIGMFARLGWSTGDTEAYDFTDVTKSLSAGVSMTGKRWNRPNDTVGVAFALNDTSSQARAYFAAGGTGILVGDGSLRHPGIEQIFEAYYSLAVMEHVRVAADWQFVNNPAYNTQRGPINFLGIRLHAEF